MAVGESCLELFLSVLWVFFQAMQFTTGATVLGSMTPHKMGLLSGEEQLNDLLYLCVF